jgi:hypothetical protein
MNSKGPCKFLGFQVFVSFSGLLLLSVLSSTILLLPIRSAFADSYSDGYSEGCSYAGRDLKGVNGHGYDESVHHGDSQFRVGCVDGYRACWNETDNQRPTQDTVQAETPDCPRGWVQVPGQCSKPDWGANADGSPICPSKDGYANLDCLKPDTRKKYEDAFYNDESLSRLGPGD